MSLLPNTVLWLAALGSALSAALLMMAITLLWREVPVDDRSYLDPLPSAMGALWPLVRLFSHLLTSRLPTRWLERIHRKLVHSSASYLLLPEHFVALQLASGCIAMLVAWFCAAALGTSPWELLVLAALFGGLLPVLWLRDRRQRRDREVRRMLPVFLDYVTLAVEAGLNMSGAMAQAIENGPAGILRQEFGLVLRDINAGLPRAQALRRLHERIQLPEIGAFVASINQAERTGGSIGKALRAQAERTRTERFQRAEKAAMEAPVKLLAPLVLFIFPTTFVIIAFPIAMMFLHGA